MISRDGKIIGALANAAAGAHQDGTVTLVSGRRIIARTGTAWR